MMNIATHFAKSFFGIAFFFVFLFLGAGTIRYPEGWTYVAVSILGLLINIITARQDTALLEERSKPGAHVPSWDTKILGALAIMTILSYTIAGLDSGRFHWSYSFGLWTTIVGVLLMVGGQTIFAIAKHQNAFFSSVVRIQTERGHVVHRSGLSAFVRHPGYLGMILSWIGFPFLLHSLASIVPVLGAIGLLLLRTYREDQFLARELTGYVSYTQETPYRLLPFVW